MRKIALLIALAALAVFAAGCDGGLSRGELLKYKAPSKIEKVTQGPWVDAYKYYVRLGEIAKGDACGGSSTEGQHRAYRLTAHAYETALLLIDRQTASARPASLPPEAPPFDWTRQKECQGVVD